MVKAFESSELLEQSLLKKTVDNVFEEINLIL